ncbi:MAG: amidohydrolase family protein [Lentisphaerae bacterium]|nr:amidohydrolase family protein [Lentisphaerota bacterium]
MAKTTYLIRHENIPMKAMFPAIDAHNHLWGDLSKLKNILGIMGQAGVVSYCDLTCNISLKMGNGGYVFEPCDISRFFHECADRYPGRFYGFTTANLAQPADKPLFSDAGEFVEKTVELLHSHVEKGAKGLKILKELGLHYRDSSGKLINIDDERLAPVWEAAGKLKIPVLMHQGDPAGFFEPATPENEHYDSLLKYPSWSFADKKRFPRKHEILQRRDRVIKNHPGTVFMLPHVANSPENMEYVSKLLDENPNVFMDFSARLDELGRQPYTSRKFFVKHQDRIYFGTDMPASLEMYRCYFRFLETYDEYFIPPDYDGTFGRFRWHICGIGLPRTVLRKIYHGNILKIIPGLKLRA